MNRIDRISAILIHLQSKKVVRAGEIAQRFGISIRTVYRDIRALEEAGIPIGAEAGKGYFISESYHLPPVMFTRDEATSLLIGEKFLEKLTDESISQPYKSALYKIRSVLRSIDKEHIESLEENISVSHMRPFPVESKMTHSLCDIQNAMVTKNILVIDYVSDYKEEQTRGREIEPIGLSYYGLHWHLIAFCHYRNDYRDFRVDRITKLLVSDKRFKEKKQEKMSDYYDHLMQTTDMFPVTLQIDKMAHKDIQNQKYYYGYINEKDLGSKIEMYFLTSSFTYFGKWLLSLGTSVTVISPDELKEHVKELVIELKNKYL